MSEEIDLTELPQTPGLEEKQALCLILQSLDIGAMYDFPMGITIQKVNEKTLRFIRALDHPGVNHFVNLFVETGEDLGMIMEVNPYLILTPVEEDEDDNTITEDISNDNSNMFV
jgi:hypothetical protein